MVYAILDQHQLWFGTAQINLQQYSFYRAMLRRERLLDCMSSVRLSVTFRYRDHIGWNSSKIISRPNSLRLMRGLTPTWAIWCNENTPKIRWNGGGSGAHKSAKSPKRCKIGPLWTKIKEVAYAFDWYQHQWPWMSTLNGWNSCKNKQNLWVHQKNFNEDRPSAAKCRPTIVVSKNIRCMQIFAGVPRGGRVKYNTCYRIPASKVPNSM